MLVCIAVCTGGTMRSETVTSLVGAMDVIRANGIACRLVVQIGGYVARNRNESVKSAQDMGADLLMFVDNDMEFKPSAIQRLVDADKDIIVAPYNGRPAPGQPVTSTLKMLDQTGDIPMDGSRREFELPAGLSKVGGAGTGFMLIKLSVFNKMDKPYFVAYEDEDGTHHTEDIEFCTRAREKGFDIFCNPTIPVGHIGNATY